MLPISPEPLTPRGAEGGGFFFFSENSFHSSVLSIFSILSSFLFSFFSQRQADSRRANVTASTESLTPDVCVQSEPFHLLLTGATVLAQLGHLFLINAGQHKHRLEISL